MFLLGRMNSNIMMILEKWVYVLNVKKYKAILIRFHLTYIIAVEIPK